ncbi:MAG: hypothetical protein M1814_005627 [Vezdaea aestivalis]|nr:MAG: hypothetical protein M1814_005627 [Vezdaea aestivalis]
MCGEDVQRISGGGAIAIVHPLLPIGGNYAGHRILLQNTREGVTDLVLSKLGAKVELTSKRQNEMTVLIHCDGDLTTFDTEAIKVLHTIPIETERGPNACDRMIIEAGGRGIIGRTVSIRYNGHIVGNGIIGWN